MNHCGQLWNVIYFKTRPLRAKADVRSSTHLITITTFVVSLLYRHARSQKKPIAMARAHENSIAVFESNYCTSLTPDK